MEIDDEAHKEPRPPLGLSVVAWKPFRLVPNYRDMEPANPVSGLKLAGTAVYLAGWPALVFVLAGDVRWMEGWIFAAWFVGLCATVIVWLYRKDPALLAERYRRPGSGGQEGWDRPVVYWIGAFFLAWIAIMPLDARRFRWTPDFPIVLKVTGVVALLGAAFFLFRAFHDNTFLSPLVRAQSERGHHVVSTGVYGFVRHPMYLGAILMFLGTPLLLGSIAGLCLAIGMTALLAVRIVGEERMLERELEGYTLYRSKVPYRLFPLLW